MGVEELSDSTEVVGVEVPESHPGAGGEARLGRPSGDPPGRRGDCRRGAA